MSIMSKITWKTMWRNKNRTLVTLIAVILATAVFTGVLTVAASALDFLIRSETESAGGYYASFSYLDEEKAMEIAKDDTVRDVSSFNVLGFVRIEEEESNWSTFMLSGIDETFPAMMPLTLVEGRMPESSSELILPEQAVDVFTYFGLPHTVGERVDLAVVTDYGALASVLQGGEPTAFSACYTIVGIYEDRAFDESLALQSLLTGADETSDVLYRNLFVTTERPSDAYPLAAKYSATARVHTRLLSYYGATEYSNYNVIIWLVAAAIILVAMIASVSVICHAFFVSVAERTRDFGLLGSIGATKKQIRTSVMLEAVILSYLGIPIGLLLGFIMDAVLFSVVGKRIANLIVSAVGEESAVQLRAVLPPVALVAVVLVALITVVVSAWIPALRAGRTVPMDAIRQTSEYRPDKKADKRSATPDALGVAGMMAKKYHRVSRKKFRPIVVSLTLSMILLITATSLGEMIETVAMASVRMENHDFRLYQLSGAQIQAIKDSGLVTRSAWIYEDENHYAYAPDGDFSTAYRKAFANIQSYDPDKPMNIQHAQISYVEDSVLEEYLIENGIDPTPYLDSDEPTALLCEQSLFTPHFQDENGEWIRYSYNLAPFDRDTKTVLFLNYQMPEEIQLQYTTGDEACLWDYLSWQDKTLAQMTPNTTSVVDGVIEMGGFDQSRAVYFEVVIDKGADGMPRVSYYEFDKENDVRRDTPICVLAGAPFVHEYKIGSHIAERPFGVGEPVSGKIELILPLSASDASFCYWAVNTDQYFMFKSLLDEMGIRYTDNCEQEENARTVRMLLDVVSYGFVGLISVLSLVGALNTISASIVMRRRDFGMLCSLGLETRKIRHILILENALHGVKALLVGMPIGLVIHFGIYLIQKEAVVTAFHLPWRALMLSVGSIVVIIAIGVFCALRNFKRLDLIDCLKNDTV